MGSSAKRKKEKKKDFQKPKLKVGKAKPKAANFTDTSFKAKSIVLSKQSISDAERSVSAQFSRNVSLLRHKSDTQRQESLAYLTSALSSNALDIDGPDVAGILLPTLQPMLLDSSPTVRQQLLKLLKCIPRDQIKARAGSLVQYTHAAMTHLSLDIRSFSIDILDWLLDHAGSEVVSCVGGWRKTLDCFMGLVGWQNSSVIQDKGWSTYRKASIKPGNETKALAKQLNVLATLIRAGLGTPKTTGPKQSTFPLWHTLEHLATTDMNRMNLFGVVEQDKFPDREDRQKVFANHFQKQVERGVEDMRKEGGELGRAGANLNRALADCISRNES